MFRWYPVLHKVGAAEHAPADREKLRSLRSSESVATTCNDQLCRRFTMAELGWTLDKGVREWSVNKRE